MNSTPVHILTETGVMTSFQIAKKITQVEMDDFINKHKKKGKSNSEIQKLLHDKIMKEIDDAVTTKKIPGLIFPSKMEKTIEIGGINYKNLPYINKLIILITQKLLEKKYSKMTLCYVINTMVNILGLSSTDFDKFHKNRSQENKDDDFTEGTE